MRYIIIITLYFGPVLAASPGHLRIMGGSFAKIEEYPSNAVILQVTLTNLTHICGGAIVNEKFVLTAAHCFMSLVPFLINVLRYRVRVGSSSAHSGGFVHRIDRIIFHPHWNRRTVDSDVALMRTTTAIKYGTNVKPAILASNNYYLPDTASVSATGWGATSFKGPYSEHLRHVTLKVVSHEECTERLRFKLRITPNMLCAGWLDIGGRDQCIRDSGTPVYHGETIVGISSMGLGCGHPKYPGINVRISQFTPWIHHVASMQSLRPMRINISLVAFLLH